MNKHLSTQFDAELSSISTRVMEMGGIVEQQIAKATQALVSFDAAMADQVHVLEKQVNTLEIQIDSELNNVIARRQPTASDLRMLLAMAKTVSNLERAGDEADRIARMAASLSQYPIRPTLSMSDLRIAAEMSAELLHRALDGLARLDETSAVDILKKDALIDAEFEGFLRKLMTYMMEDARTISACVDLIFVAKAIERIGDHAKNIAEFTIYIARGADVRHTDVDSIEKVVR